MVRDGAELNPDDEPSAYGLAIANLALNRRDAARSVVTAWAQRSLRIRALMDPAAARELARTGTQAVAAPQVSTAVPAQTPVPQATLAPPVALAPAASAPPPGPATTAPATAAMIPQATLAQPAAPAPAPTQSVLDQPLALTDTEPQPQPAAPARRGTTRNRRATAPAGASPAAAGGAPAATRSTTPAPGREAARRSCGGWCLMGLDRPAEAVMHSRVPRLQVRSRTGRMPPTVFRWLYLRLGLTSQASSLPPRRRSPAPGARPKSFHPHAARHQRLSGRPLCGGLDGLDARATIHRTDRSAALARLVLCPPPALRRSRQVFEALAAAGNPDAVQGVAAIREATHGRY